MPFKHLTFLQKIKHGHGKYIRRDWLPGYLLLEFDVRRDRWQQIIRMPYAIGYLGSPTPVPSEIIDDLIRKCPERLSRPSAISCIAPGTNIKILRGPFSGHQAVVTWSDRRTLKVPLMLFGSRNVEVTLRSADVEVVK